jgi:uncharacterized protein (TIGR02145 family)
MEYNHLAGNLADKFNILKMKKKIRLSPAIFFMLNVLMVLISGCKKEEKESTILDADGNVYHSVVIGNQTWLVENLRTTKYRDGSSIANITDSAQWENYEFGAYCNYDNLKSNGNMFGRLYNWTAANSGVLAPVGWHVASKAEWDTLINYLGGTDVTGEKLKGPYSYSWNDQYFDKSLSSGFNALPCGLRGFHDGSFDFINLFAFWWTTTEESSHSAWYIGVYNFTHVINVDYYSKHYGLSVRCIKD